MLTKYKDNVKGGDVDMALVPFNRRRNMPNNLFNEFYNMVDDFFGGSWISHSGLRGENFKVNIQEKDNEYIVEAELPGVQKDQINLELRDDRLTILVKREDSINKESKNYIHRESHYSSMSRSIYLPDAKEEGTKAKLENGVLNIIVPKEEDKNTRRINIE